MRGCRLLPLIAIAWNLAAADLAIVNARIWTADPARPWVEAMRIEGNRIAAVGTTAEIRSRTPPGTRLLDAQGRLVTPGLNDAHIHFLSGSLGLENIDLTGVCTLEGMQGKVAEYAKAHPEKEWITGRGWEYFCIPGQRLPRKEDLDAVVKDRPVYLIAYDGHTGWANSKALERADINRATRFSGFGEIVKDAKTGEPTGSLKENAQSLVRRKVPQPGRAEKLEAIRRGLKLAASLGLTSIQNASGDEEEVSLYRELLARGELTVRTSIAISVSPGAPLERAAQVAALKAKYAGPMLAVRSVKLMIDGVIESYTAAMLAPYADRRDAVGEPAWSQPEFQAMVNALDARGIQIYTHAIGDRGVRLTLDAYRNAARRNKTQGRHRIEHIETVSPDDLPRFAREGVIASMQPIHADPSGVAVWSEAVGEARLPLAFAWRAVEQAGGRLIFSSDWPASISVSPIRGVHNAVNRRTIDGKPEGGWIPAQRVSLETALRAYTSSAAYASFEEAVKGQIKPGMLADAVVWSQDLFKTDPMRLHQTRPVWTLFDGRIIYTSE